MPVTCSSTLQTNYKTTLQLCAFSALLSLKQRQICVANIHFKAECMMLPCFPPCGIPVQKEDVQLVIQICLCMQGCFRQLVMIPEGFQMHKGQMRTSLILLPSFSYSVG